MIFLERVWPARPTSTDTSAAAAAGTIVEIFFFSSAEFFSSATSHPRLCRRVASGEDAGVGPAPAEVAGHRLPHVARRWVGVLREKACAGDDHPRSTEAALQGVGVDEGLLDRRHRLGGAEPLDRR